MISDRSVTTRYVEADSYPHTGAIYFEALIHAEAGQYEYKLVWPYARSEKLRRLLPIITRAIRIYSGTRLVLDLGGRSLIAIAVVLS